MHYPLASPIHGGGGPRKRWKGLASGDNASYSFLHHSGGTPFGGWRHHLCPQESMSLDFRVAVLPYSTAITDSLDSQVAAAPLRIQFAGVTPVPLPPQRSWGTMDAEICTHMMRKESIERLILPPE